MVDFQGPFFLTLGLENEYHVIFHFGLFSVCVDLLLLYLPK